MDLEKLAVKAPIVSAASALMLLMHSKTETLVMKEALPLLPPQAAAVSPPSPSVFKPLDLSMGLDQDTAIPTTDMASSVNHQDEIGGDNDDGDAIDEELDFISRASTPDSPPSIKKRRKVAVHKARSSSYISKTTAVPSSYKRIPSKYLNDPEVLVEGLRLAAKGDEKNVNSLHCFVRKELLEVFVLDGSGDGQHRVGLRCVHCGCLPKSERTGTSMSTFFPKSVEDLYRSVCTWQRIHFKSCRHIPDDKVNTYWHLKEADRTRGKKSHWIKTALDMGFCNVDGDRSGIVYCPTIGMAQDDVDMAASESDDETEEEELLL
ncbi:MAG: hypothetical protein SGARI_000874 [Bacillariaceae sp.]